MKTTRDLIKPLMAIIIISAIAAPSRPALAAVDHYEVRVDGLACPFCAYGLEKKLKKLPGVSKVHIDLDSGKASFDVSGAVLMPDLVGKAIRDAGFTPRSFTLAASGAVRGTGESLNLDVGGGQSLRLHGGTALDQLRALVRGGHHDVVITGAARKAGGAWQIEVAEVRVRPGS